MTNDDEHDEDFHHHTHFYISPGLFPGPDDTDTEWMQRATMLGGMVEEVASTIFHLIRLAAPVMMTSDQMLPSLIAGIGVLGQGINRTGTQQLAKQGMAPLNAQDEQLRTIRDELADPNTPPHVREALLVILQHNLEQRKQQPVEAVEDTEWPEEIGGVE